MRGVRCAGPGAPGELSRRGPEARRRPAWTPADSRRRAAGRAGREGVPPGGRAARCERRGGKGRRGTPGRGGRARARAGRPPRAIRAASRPTLTRRAAPDRPHPRPCRRRGRRFPRAASRRCARGGRPAGSRRLEPTCAAEPEVADSRARRSRRPRSSPRKGFWFQRKEGRKDNSQLPLPPSPPGGRAGPCPGRRRRRPNRRDFPGGPATRSAVREFAPPRFMVPAGPRGGRTPQPLPAPRRASCVPWPSGPPRAARAPAAAAQCPPPAAVDGMMLRRRHRGLDQLSRDGRGGGGSGSGGGSGLPSGMPVPPGRDG